MLEQGGKIHNAIDCCKFLQGKFGNKSDPSFHILELTQQSLDEAREEARWKDPQLKDQTNGMSLSLNQMLRNLKQHRIFVSVKHAWMTMEVVSCFQCIS